MEVRIPLQELVDGSETLDRLRGCRELASRGYRSPKSGLIPGWVAEEVVRSSLSRFGVPHQPLEFTSGPVVKSHMREPPYKATLEVVLILG